MNNAAMNTETNKTLSNTDKDNHMKNYPYNPEVISFEQFHEAIGTFRTYQADKSNHPTYDSTYGTKYPGKLSHIHYAFFAVLRGKSPEITTHDVNSESYRDIKRHLNGLTDLERDYYGARQKLVEAFGLTPQQIAHVIETYGTLQ
tara:strand:+ start:729 stop:1163 length:435 start_codon:yes stop_codon:yes gene_type:complete